MTLILAALLVLYLIDKKPLRVISVCLLPVFVVLPAFFRLKTTEGLAFYAGLIMIGAAPLIELACGRAALKLAGMKTVSGTGISQTPEDILDNKKKWGLIKAGFIASLVLALVLLAAVLTLNTKVNNMYRFTTEQQNTIEEQQRQIDELKEKVEKK